MNWISALIKVLGSVSPFTAPLVQLQSELDADALQVRVNRLEEPLAYLHEDIAEVSRLLYATVRTTGEARLEFEETTYRRFGRCLAVLETHGLIECARRLGTDVPVSISISDPAYLVYLGARFDDREKMAKLITTVDGCVPGGWLDGRALASELTLPVPVVKACFDLYEAKGFGFCSREIGRVSYSARV